MKEKQGKKAASNYERGVNAEPKMASKGRGGLVAEKIISLALANGVPMHEDQHLIEILSTIDLYEEIPTELYKAVAEILVFVYKMNGKI